MRNVAVVVGVVNDLAGWWMRGTTPVGRDRGVKAEDWRRRAAVKTAIMMILSIANWQGRAILERGRSNPRWSNIKLRLQC